MRRLVLAVIGLSAIVRASGIDRPWAYETHDGWGGAFYSNIARNYLRYGYLETRLAPVVDTGTVPSVERHYYLTHPPGIGLAVSLGFRALGVHEWVARLIPLLVSLANLYLLFRLGTRLWSESVGLLAAMLLASIPLEVVYATHVDPQGPAVTFFSLLLFLGYVEERPLLCWSGLGLGALFDWPIHYMAGLVALHALVYHRARRWALFLPAGSLALVLGFLLYPQMVAPKPEQQYLRSSAATAFLFWSGIKVDPHRVPSHRIEPPSVREWVHRELERTKDLVSIPVALLALLGVAIGARHRNASFLVLLIGWGAVHVLLFPVGSYVHDYWLIYLVPGTAIATAIGIEEGIARLSRAARSPAFARAALGGATTALCIYLLSVAALWKDASYDPEPSLGMRLNEITDAEEGWLSLTAIDARDGYYADRRARDEVNSIKSFQDARADGVSYRYFVVPRELFELHDSKPLFRELSHCCRWLSFEDFYLFDLSPMSQDGGGAPERDEGAGTSRPRPKESKAARGRTNQL